MGAERREKKKRNRGGGYFLQCIISPTLGAEGAKAPSKRVVEKGAQVNQTQENLQAENLRRGKICLQQRRILGRRKVSSRERKKGSARCAPSLSNKEERDEELWGPRATVMCGKSG